MEEWEVKKVKSVESVVRMTKNVKSHRGEHLLGFLCDKMRKSERNFAQIFRVLDAGKKGKIRRKRFFVGLRNEF